MFLYPFVRRRRPQILVHAITFEQLFGFSLWPWPRFSKVKYGICYISAKNDPIAMKQKANISIELYG